MFSLGFSTIGCPDYTLDEIIDMAVGTGLRGVELRFVNGTTDFDTQDEFSPRHIDATRRRFTDRGLTVVSLDTSVRMTSLDQEERARQLDQAKRWADIAAGLGAPYLRVFGGPTPTDQDTEATLDAIAAGLSLVSEEADTCGVQALLESHDSFSTSASILDLYARGASDRLGVLWDTLHTFRHGEDPQATWDLLGTRIRHVHVKDSRTADAGGFDFALTGEGTMPLDTVFDVLRTADYSGFVHFEWEKGWHREIAEPEVAIPHFARFMSGRL